MNGDRQKIKFKKQAPKLPHCAEDVEVQEYVGLEQIFQIDHELKAVVKEKELCNFNKRIFLCNTYVGSINVLTK